MDLRIHRISLCNSYGKKCCLFKILIDFGMVQERHYECTFQLNIDQPNIVLLVWLSETILFLLGTESV